MKQLKNILNFTAENKFYVLNKLSNFRRINIDKVF
jgi:hypothetical protein